MAGIRGYAHFVDESSLNLWNLTCAQERMHSWLLKFKILNLPIMQNQILCTSNYNWTLFSTTHNYKTRKRAQTFRFKPIINPHSNPIIARFSPTPSNYLSLGNFPTDPHNYSRRQYLRLLGVRLRTRPFACRTFIAPANLALVRVHHNPPNAFAILSLCAWIGLCN
jgi:hypothetical protein